MAYQKLQTTAALSIVSTDNANIPIYNIVESGTCTIPLPSELEDNTALFVTKGVKPGDVVYNNVTLQAATVMTVVNQTTVILNANIFTVIGEAYTLYSQNVDGNSCVLYVGTGGTLRVITAGGQDVTFNGILGGTFLPVQIDKVFKTGTTATNLIALW
jgi:hypothetical protein